MNTENGTRSARGLYIAFPEGTETRPSHDGGAYAAALLREAESRRVASREEGPFVAWMAGGEPWRAGDEVLSRFSREVSRCFPTARRAERSIEWFHGESSPRRLACLLRAGWNRICFTGRTRAPGYRPAEEAGDLARAVRAAREAGFPRVAADIDPFDEGGGSVGAGEAAASGAGHISLVEDPRSSGDEESWIERYEEARRLLEEAGLRRYQTFSFAAEGKRSASLLLITAGGRWVGIGAGAVSTTLDEKRGNGTDPDEYIRVMEMSGDPAVYRESRTAEDRFRERVFGALQRTAGIPLGSLAGRYGRERVSILERRAAPLLRAGLLRRRGDRLVPSSAGLLTAEGLSLVLFGDAEQENPKPFS